MPAKFKLPQFIGVPVGDKIVGLAIFSLELAVPENVARGSSLVIDPPRLSHFQYREALKDGLVVDLCSKALALND